MNHDEKHYAWRLAGVLNEAARHRHLPTDPWAQGLGTVAFDVELCDADDLPAGYIARVVISVASDG
jgi:hypothetical protein